MGAGDRGKVFVALAGPDDQQALVEVLDQKAAYPAHAVMGAASVESFVNYPTWPLIGANEFRAYHRALSPLIIGYMVIPLLVATILTIVLLWFRPASIPRWMIWLAIVLQLVTWVSTFTIQFPIQGRLSADGLSLPLIERLRMTSFWFRRVPHTANALLFLWMMHVFLRRNLTSTWSYSGTRDGE